MSYVCIVFKPHCNATGLISNHKDKQYQQNKRIKMAQSEFRIIRETQVNTPESLLTMANGQTVKVSFSRNLFILLSAAEIAL